MRIFVALFVLATLMTGLPVAANLLSNSGFETGDLSGWTVGGKNGGYGVSTDGTTLPVTSVEPSMPNFYFQSYQNVRSGNYGAYGITAGDSQASYREYVSFAQNIIFAEGFYRLGFWLSIDNEIGGAGISSALSDRRIGIFVDGNYVAFTNALPLDNTLTPTWREFSSAVFLPNGSHHIEFRISGSGTKRSGISLDDTFVSAVPEPSSFALGGLVVGWMLLRASRRNVFTSKERVAWSLEGGGK